MSADSDHSFTDDRDDPLGGRVDSPEEFIEAWAAHEREGARLALDAVRIATGGLWVGDGNVSMGAWLRDRCRMRSSDATQLLSDGRFLAANTIVATAAVTGRLSVGQVRALRVVVKPTTAEWFHDHQEMLVGGVEAMNVADAENTCQKWRAYAEAVADMPEPVICKGRGGLGVLVTGPCWAGSCSTRQPQSKWNRRCRLRRGSTVLVMRGPRRCVLLTRRSRSSRSSTQSCW